MTVLFQGTLNSPKGLRESAVRPIANAAKKLGRALQIRVSMEAEGFPDGRTTITLYISTDGGVTFRAASMACDNPKPWRGPAPHYWTMGYELDTEAVPTHAKFSIDAPQAFSTTVILETVDGSN